MPIGPVTPGSYVTVTPDPGGVIYASIQAPTATMPVIGADIQVLALELLNIQENLYTLKAPKAAPTFTGAGHIGASASMTVDATAILTIAGALATSSGGTITISAATQILLNGITRYRQPARPTHTTNILIDTSADIWILPSGASSTDVVRLRTTTGLPLPLLGERIIVTLPAGFADGRYYKVQREDGTGLCQLCTDTVNYASCGNVTGIPSGAEFEFDGALWRGVRGWGIIDTAGVLGTGW